MKETNNQKQNMEIHGDKNKFILGMLDYVVNRKIDPLVSDKLLKLVGTEIGKDDELNKEILERLGKVEKILHDEREFAVEKKVENELVKQSEDEVQEKKPIPLHRPIETKNFISLFNNSEGLKYLTHRFNGDKPNYENFIQICKEEFEKSKIDYPNVPSRLLKRIEVFAFEREPNWYIRKGTQKVEFKNGWSKPEFVEWYKNGTNHPASNTKWNQEMIIPFKETIEVRAGNLLSIINEQINVAFGKDKDNFIFTINEKEINTSEFYTDVDMFQQALFHIFSMIKERGEKNFKFKIDINYVNNTINGGEFKKLSITHINSEPTKNSNDPEFAKGDLKTLQYNLWGLCNYEIVAKFPDGYAKKILLTDDKDEFENHVKTNKSLPVDESAVKGFTHILKFY